MKEKISITLDTKIVSKIEAIASKQGVNRSKFIERILKDKLDTTPVLILAAWAEINDMPKSLLKYQKKQVIVRQIESLYKQGFKDIHVTVSSETLKEYLENNFPEINIIFENKPIGSGGALKKFARHIGKRFLFMHCDVLSELNLNRLIEFHMREKTDITLVLKTLKNNSKYGTATMEGNRIINFEEKPKNSDVFLVYIGIGVAQQEIFEKIDDESKFEFELHKVKNKVGYIFEGMWKSFESEKDYVN